MDSSSLFLCTAKTKWSMDYYLKQANLQQYRKVEIRIEKTEAQ